MAGASAGKIRTWGARTSVVSSVAIGLLLAATPASAEFQRRAAINDDRFETISLEGSKRTVTLDSTRAAGVWVNKWVVGHTYLLEVKGTFRYQSDPRRRADAECTTDVSGGALPGGFWRSQRWTLGSGGRDYFDVKYRVGATMGSFDWVPLDPYPAQALEGEPLCSSVRTYRAPFTPRVGTLNFVIDDPSGFADNEGILEIAISRQPFVSPRMVNGQSYQCPKWTEENLAPVGNGTVGELATGVVMVDSRRNPWQVRYPYATDPKSADLESPYYPHVHHPDHETGHWGIYTCNWVMPDATYRIKVRGVYTYDERVKKELGPQYALSDAECTTGYTSGDTAWRRDRFVTTSSIGRVFDYMDLYLNYGPVEWTPLQDENGDGCADDEAHTYVLEWTPGGTGPLHFKIYDIVYREMDNRGDLCMEVLKIG